MDDSIIDNINFRPWRISKKPFPHCVVQDIFSSESYTRICNGFKSLQEASPSGSKRTTFEIDAATHSHPPGSRTGWIHNDYNPGWFARDAGSDQTIFSDEENCKYKSSYEKTNYVGRMRYITIIYYLLNDGWEDGDGGETGIYSSSSQSPNLPDIAIPPINNTILMFECRPDSYHSFIASKKQRNSVTLWLHRPINEARKQWPYHEPIYWR